MKKLLRLFRERVLGSADPRITAPYATLTDSILLFLTLMVILGLHSYIFVEVIEKLPEDRKITKVYILFAYISIATILSTTIVGLARYYSSGRPLQKLSRAFQKIAAGDFSVRLAPRRKTKKKNYIDVMFEDFNTMASQLASIETLKTDFVSNVSHEIKTPLSVISGYAQRLRQENMSEAERRECVDTILGASSKLSTLVTNILRLNRLENQTALPAEAPYDLGEELRLAALSFEELWEKKNISFEADIADGVFVTQNKAMMQIVWNNLFSNAVKFTPSGGSVTVALRAAEDAAGRFAEVSVRDSGCGMDAATRLRIFDKFYQGDTSHAAEGNGLGLALAKRALKAASSSIAVASEPGRGSVFTVRLPR
ncbi:MAG: two component sensor kinase/histidine kinase [Treponematales bacterium]